MLWTPLYTGRCSKARKPQRKACTTVSLKKSIVVFAACVQKQTCYFRFCLFLPFPLPLPLPFSSSAKRTCFREEAPRALERPEERDNGRRLPCRDPELDLPLDCWRLLSFFSRFSAALFGAGILLIDVCLEEEAGAIFSLCFSTSSALFWARKAKALSSFIVIGLRRDPPSFANSNKAGESTSFTSMLSHLDFASRTACSHFCCAWFCLFMRDCTAGLSCRTRLSTNCTAFALMVCLMPSSVCPCPANQACILSYNFCCKAGTLTAAS